MTDDNNEGTDNMLDAVLVDPERNGFYALPSARVTHAVPVGGPNNNKQVCTNKPVPSGTTRAAGEITCKTCLRKANISPLTPLDPPAKLDDIPGLTTTEENATMAAKKPEEEINQIISDVHDFIDRIKVMANEGPSTADAIKELTEEADALIRELPTEKRTSLRADVKAAGEVPSAEVAVPTPTVVGEVEDDYKDVPGVDKLMAEGNRKIKSGIKHGVQAASVAGDLCQAIINIRTKFDYEDLPDLMGVGKRPRNAVRDLFGDVLKGIDEEDRVGLSAFKSLKKSQENKMSDVLVEWIRALDNPDSWESFAEMFPTVAEIVTNSREQVAEETEDGETPQDVVDPAEGVITVPSEALYTMYAEKGITIPRKGRTQLEREKRAAKALAATRKELTAVAEKVETEGQGVSEELITKKTELEEKVAELSERVPAEVAAQAEKASEKTKAQRQIEKVDKTRDVVTSITQVDSFKKFEQAEKDALLAKLEGLAGHIATQVAALKRA
jgi:hypothetical protein